jgi:hypothetical protein
MGFFTSAFFPETFFLHPPPTIAFILNFDFFEEIFEPEASRRCQGVVFYESYDSEVFLKHLTFASKAFFWRNFL